MVGETTKTGQRKRKNSIMVDNYARDVNAMEGLTQVNQEAPQDGPVPNIHIPEEDMVQEDDTAEDAPTQDTIKAARGIKKKRGPTKKKNLARDPANRIQIQFTDSGEPYGPGSVHLSSFLGPLV
ncbi:uncharacterized protein LOC109846907 [Asparagus officinalis]|uniref:uncharacterized protein LOC109846907 n=1 Tax=Asparagus officinalis TaxID=4686 RepID=UPI00098E3D7F|nr:uncharacterized protein LOC109846907 [Asparagus officinalis]